MIVDEIATYLVTSLTTTGTLDIGTVGNGVYTNYMPDVQTKVNAIGIYESEAEPTIHSSVIPEFRVQIIIRNNDYTTGRNTIFKNIYDLLHNKSGFLSSSNVTHCRSLNYPPITYRNPETEKWEFSTNYVLTVVETLS